MRRILASVFITIGMLTVTIGAASAEPPPGQGLEEPFPVQCEGQGTVMIVLTRGGAPMGWTLDGQQFVAQSLTLSDPDGPVFFSKTFGTKAGLATFTCEAELEEDGEVVHVDAVIALVPPQ
jgi:hypothetical protein